MNILSFGAGVNSTAILALVKLKKLDLGDFKTVFADTDGENPETYCHIREIQKEFEVSIVEKKPSLYDYCFERKIIPTRMFRWCTSKWKILPINAWLKENNIEDYKLILGFAKGEERRVKNRTEVEYPLIEMNIDRDGCKKIIGEARWKVPPKSGCFFCPFQRKLEWVAMRENAPSLWEKAVALERNCQRSEFYLHGDKPLTELDSSQTRLSPFDSYQHCMCSAE